MRNLLLMFTVLINLNISLFLSSSLNCATLNNLALGMHHILLPDGKTMFGETSAVIGYRYFDLNDLDSDSHTGFTKLSTFTSMLEFANTSQNPSWIFWSTPSLPEIKEFLNVYASIIEDASHLNPSALMLIETILRTGQINKIYFPGLKPQPERAALFKELYDWRTGQRSDAHHAIEAIRIERERLDAIAAEEEDKRKAEADAKAAEQAARTAMEVSTKKKLTDDTPSPTLRQRRVTTTKDDQPEEEKQPLLWPIKAH